MIANQQIDAPRIGEDSEEIQRLRKILLSALRRKGSPKFEGQFEDIVQKVLVKVVEQRAQREASQPAGINYWIRAAQNALIDETRRVRFQFETQTAEGAEKLWLSEAPSPDRVLDSKEMGQAIYDCLSRLAETRKQAVTLYLHGYSARDASEVLSYPEKRVRNLVFRGLTDLKNCLFKKGIHR